MYVTCRGDNSIKIFNRNLLTGALTANGTIAVPYPITPDQIIISKDGRNVYLLAHGSAVVLIYNRSISTGALTEIGSIYTYQDSASFIVISADGLNVYVTHESTNTIAIFNRNILTGVLTANGTIVCDGRTMCIAADGLNVYTTNSITKSLSIYNRDILTGALVTNSIITNTYSPYTISVYPTFFTPTPTPATSVSAVFAFGNSDTYAATVVTNTVSNIGIISQDIFGVGTVRYNGAAASFGTGKAIFAYGQNLSRQALSLSNIISNDGTVAYDTAGVGTPRAALAAASYGSGKALFGYGDSGTTVGTTTVLNITNRVTDNGVISADAVGVGTVRAGLAAASYGTDKAIFGFGFTYLPAMTNLSLTNLVSNAGVIATDTIGVGLARRDLAAAGYGGDKAVFGGGNGALNTGSFKTYNLVGNNGTVLNDNAFATFSQWYGAAASFGQSGAEQAIFSFGTIPNTTTSFTMIINNNGIPSSEVARVGTLKAFLSGAKL